MECCVLENCPFASNLIATFIEFHVDGHELDQINYPGDMEVVPQPTRWFGACVLFRSHFQPVSDDMAGFALDPHSHIYLLTQAWQDRLRQNQV